MQIGSLERHQGEHPPSERWVSMTNDLARAGWGLSMGERRLMVAAIAKIDSRRKTQYGEVVRVRISAQEYTETYPVDRSTAYTALQQAARALFDGKIEVTFLPERGSLKRKKNAHGKLMRWVGGIEYSEGEGWVELSFWPDIVPHLMGLQKHFTTYRLMHTQSLRSAHSWKLLQLLISWKNGEESGWVDIPIEDFHVTMEASELQRKNFGKLRTQIIEPAIKELSEKDGWLIEWRKTNYGGRRVEGLHFTFQRNPQQGLFPSEQPSKA